MVGLPESCHFRLAFATGHARWAPDFAQVTAMVTVTVATMRRDVADRLAPSQAGDSNVKDENGPWGCSCWWYSLPRSLAFKVG
jgi:hypothetical protein